MQGKETQTRGFIVSLGELQRSTAQVGGSVDCTTEIWPSLNSSRKNAIVERNPSQVPVEAMLRIQQHMGEGTLGEILQKVGYVKTLDSLIQEALDFLLHNSDSVRENLELTESKSKHITLGTQYYDNLLASLSLEANAE
ncbi:hypothetical protein ATANTOWER_008017 [Ataeniobius toweri]|uniref:Uncharacterized protein n=1 Tax=Ataeniobius toweri TaxID=208326 RepID=A0ABU7AE18_9TELE|nr:hypothetical protein [Ataeniobius toweri]